MLRETTAAITRDTLQTKHEGKLSMKKLDKNVFEFTDPALWTDIIFDYMSDPRYFKMGPENKYLTPA